MHCTVLLLYLFFQSWIGMIRWSLFLLAATINQRKISIFHASRTIQKHVTCRSITSMTILPWRCRLSTCTMTMNVQSYDSPKAIISVHWHSLKFCLALCGRNRFYFAQQDSYGKCTWAGTWATGCTRRNRGRKLLMLCWSGIEVEWWEDSLVLCFVLKLSCSDVLRPISLKDTTSNLFCAAGWRCCFFALCTQHMYQLNHLKEQQ